MRSIGFWSSRDSPEGGIPCIHDETHNTTQFLPERVGVYSYPVTVCYSSVAARVLNIRIWKAEVVQMHQRLPSDKSTYGTDVKTSPRSFGKRCEHQSPVIAAPLGPKIWVLKARRTQIAKVIDIRARRILASSIPEYKYGNESHSLLGYRVV